MLLIISLIICNQPNFIVLSIQGCNKDNLRLVILPLRFHTSLKSRNRNAKLAVLNTGECKEGNAM